MRACVLSKRLGLVFDQASKSKTPFLLIHTPHSIDPRLTEPQQVSHSEQPC